MLGERTMKRHIPTPLPSIAVLVTGMSFAFSN
jgi:hypothetical protein